MRRERWVQDWATGERTPIEEYERARDLWRMAWAIQRLRRELDAAKAKEDGER